ncbi:MAG: hypothetical protein H0T42_07345 [Deltaproteobacteria bacterium]|nr:hypothetical protein [Deltaproteobacteria bacterium]
MWFTWWSLVFAIVGAFGTAWMHQHTGRDPRTGGVIGLAVGGVLGPFYLVSFWVWLYYTRLNVHVIKRRRQWYEWWRP